MFQHNTEGGRTNLLATLGKRSRLLQTRLAGTQWKVLVYPHLSIRTWTKRSLHGLPQVGMAVETSCELVHDVTGELLPPGTQITILQIRQGDCNTDGYVEVKVLFSAKGVHCLYRARALVVTEVPVPLGQ